MKYYVIDLSQYNIPSTINLAAGYGLYEILKSLMMNVTSANDIINAFLRL